MERKTVRLPPTLIGGSDLLGWPSSPIPDEMVVARRPDHRLLQEWVLGGRAQQVEQTRKSGTETGRENWPEQGSLSLGPEGGRRRAPGPEPRGRRPNGDHRW